jgi:O-antigen/teichoic acid export membrane protein
LRILVLIGSLSLVTNAFSLDWLLTGTSKVVPVAISNIVAQLVYTAGIFLFLSSSAAVWVVPVAALAGSVAATTIVYYDVAHRFGLSWPTVSIRRAREIVPSSMLLGFASLMSMTYDKVDAIMLGYFRPMEEVGLYTATYKLMWMVMSFLPILATVFFPLIARGSARGPGDADPDSELYLELLFLVSVPLIAGGILLAEPLTAFVIGERFTGAGILFALLLPNVLFGGLAIYYAGMRLVAVNRNREYVIAVSTGALLNVAINFVAIPLWGGVGAAITTCASQAAVAGVAAWFGRRVPGPPLAASAVVPIVATLGMLVVLHLIMRVAPNLQVLILVAIGAVTYGLAWKLARASRWA